MHFIPTTPVFDMHGLLWTDIILQLALLVISALLSMAHVSLSGTQLRRAAHRRATVVIAWTMETVQVMLAVSGVLTVAASALQLRAQYYLSSASVGPSMAIACAVPVLLIASHSVAIYAVDWIDIRLHPRATFARDKVRPFMLLQSCFEAPRIWVLEPAPLPPMPRRWTGKTAVRAGKMPGAEVGIPSAKDGERDRVWLSSQMERRSTQAVMGEETRSVPSTGWDSDDTTSRITDGTDKHAPNRRRKVTFTERSVPNEEPAVSGVLLVETPPGNGAISAGTNLNTAEIPPVDAKVVSHPTPISPLAGRVKQIPPTPPASGSGYVRSRVKALSEPASAAVMP